MPGPLAGVKIVEFETIGPAPFAGMMLSDLGATVLRVARPGGQGIDAGRVDILSRGRTALVLDLKSASGRTQCLAAIAQADALIEGYRPGTMERLGLGPDDCFAINPQLVFGRVTGWGRDGPLAHTAGHDINYIALAGILGAMGPADGPPTPPLNLVGDFGGGGMLLAFGLVCALLEARVAGRGQIVDASMLDGATLLMSSILGLVASGKWSSRRGENFLDGSAPFYRCYRCADGCWMAVGAIESKFYRALLDAFRLDDVDPDAQWDRSLWPMLAERFADLFARRTRDAWTEHLRDVDACVAPVLGVTEVAQHPHNVARGAFDEQGQPRAAPLFSRTPASPHPGNHDAVLNAFGLRADAPLGDVSTRTSAMID